MEEDEMMGDDPSTDCRSFVPSRREFLAGLAALGLARWTESAFGAAAGLAGWGGFPDRPEERPLDFHALANAFDA